MKFGDETIAELQKEHREGPLPSFFQSSSQQFKEYHQKQFKVTTHRNNNCVVIGGVVVLVRNFVAQDGKHFVIFQKFKSHSSLYTYPLQSEKIGVRVVSHLDTKMQSSLASHISTKCVLQSRKDQYVAVPLSHIMY